MIRQARISAGMTQKTLAENSGCKQSAVSMFEAGKRDALAYDSIVKIAGLLKVELPKLEGERPREPVHEPAHGDLRPPFSFCPGFECPSNAAYMVGATVFLLPTGAAGGGKRCLMCGEAVSALCHACGAPASRQAACCAECGAALVPFPHADFAGSAAEWVRFHNDVLEKLRVKS